MTLLLRYVLGFLAIGLLWLLGSLSLGEALLPNPVTTTVAVIKALMTATFWDHIFVSLYRLLMGLMVSVLIAFPLGLLLGHSKRSDWLGAPLLFITYPIPKIVFLPVFFMLLGLGESSRICLIALTAGYQLLVIMRASALSIDPSYEKAFFSMGGTKWQAVRYVYIPAALPELFTALKVATGTAIAVLFLAESFATTTGLGFLIMDAWGMGDTLAMFVAILGMSVLGLAVYASVGVLEKAFCPWIKR